MSTISIRVNGLPAPQGSKRHVGGGRMVESSKALAPWRQAVRAETQRALERGATPFETRAPIAASIIFYLPRPKGHTGARGIKPSAPQFPAGTPDLDKLVRAVCDGLAEGGAFPNDSQIVQTFAVKEYATFYNTPGAEITLNDVVGLAL